MDLAKKETVRTQSRIRIWNSKARKTKQWSHHYFFLKIRPALLTESSNQHTMLPREEDRGRILSLVPHQASKEWESKEKTKNVGLCNRWLHRSRLGLLSPQGLERSDILQCVRNPSLCSSDTIYKDQASNDIRRSSICDHFIWSCTFWDWQWVYQFYNSVLYKVSKFLG